MACSVMFICTLLSIAIQNLKFDQVILIKFICIAIMINAYIQCILSIFQVIHFNLQIPINFYSIDGQIIKEYMNPFRLDNRNRIIGGVTQVNELAEVLTWGLIANIYLFNKKNLIFIINSIIFSAFCYISQSNSIILYSIFMFGYGLFLRKINVIYSKKFFFTGTILAIAFACNYFDLYHRLYQLLYYHVSLLPQNMLQPRNVAASNMQRLLMWDKGISMFLQHPLFGVGWNYYASNFHLVKSTIIPANTWVELSIPMNCHNLLIQLLATTGIIGTAIFLLPIVFLYKKIIKLADKDLQIVPFSIMSIILLHSMVEFPLFETYMLIPLIILIAPFNKEKVLAIASNKFKLVIIVTSIISIWQIIIGLSNYLILAHIKPNTNFSKNLTNNIINQYMIGTNPFWEVYSDANFAQNASVTTNNNQQFFKITLRNMEKITLFVPSPAFTDKLTILYLINDEPEKAELWLSYTLLTYPNNKQIIKKDLIALTGTNTKLKSQIEALYQLTLSKLPK